MTAVFLSHRRPDGSAYVRRLSQELAVPGGGIEIVPGLESLVPGTDVVEAIEGIVDRSDVVLAVIGPDWLTDTDQHGRRRLDLATDTVRIELATALRRPGPVIPVLVGGAIMPQPDELPVDLSALARRTPIELRDTFLARRRCAAQRDDAAARPGAGRRRRRFAEPVAGGDCRAAGARGRSGGRRIPGQRR